MRTMGWMATIAAATVGTLGCGPQPVIGHEQSIVGGVDEPGMMSVACLGRDLQPGLEILCTGNLITPRIVLTAGHCGYSLSDQLLLEGGVAWFGMDIGAPDFSSAFVDREVHPDYVPLAGNDPGEFDVGVWVLEDDAPYRPSWLRHDELTGDDLGATVTLAGYGLTGPGSGDAGHKRSAQITVDDLDEQWLYSDSATNPGGANGCNGDSGAPMLLDLGDGTWMQWGLNSFADSECAVFTGHARVDLSAEWLLDQVEAVHGTRDVCEVNGFYGDGACDELCDEPDPDCDPGDDDTGDDDAGDDDDGADDDAGGDAVEGCECAVSAGPGRASLALVGLVALLAVAARRRRASLPGLCVLLALSWCTGCPQDDDDVTVEDDDDDSDGPGAWAFQQVGDGDVGLQARIAVAPDGTLALAYRANQPTEDGICDEVPVDPPPRLRQALYVAQLAPWDVAWTVELVDDPVVAFTPTGHDLTFDAADRPAVAYQGGDPEGQFCGGNDAIFAYRGAGGWVLETAATSSADHVTGEALSDTGFVVGGWPGLAFDAGGAPVLSHRDTHFGSLQSEDLLAADAELAWFDGGDWSHDTIDAGAGGGEHGALLFDPQGRPVALHAISIEAQQDPRHGVWAARQEAYEQWTRVRLHTGAIHQEIATAVHPSTGDLVVAFYSAGDRAVVVRRLHDHEQFGEAAAWDEQIVGSAQYDEGQHVSLAFTPSGQLALAYRRCRLLSSGSEACDPNDEAVIFALEEPGGWSLEVVREADVGSCGEYTTLAIDGDGVATIGFRCTVETGDGFAFRLFAASRPL